VSEVFRTLFELLRLRAGPQDLPSSWLLTAIAVAAFAGQALVTSQNLEGGGESARSILSIAIQFLAVAVLLRLRGHPERLEQTLLALAGTGFLLGLVAFALLAQADADVQQPVLAILFFAIFGWSLAVDANIFRHALNVSLSTGVLVAVILLALTYVALEFAYMRAA
jgi:hypothetical protein